MASSLRFEGKVLHFFFPPNVRNTVQDLERELSNPHLLETMRRILPGLSQIAITFEAERYGRPEEILRGDQVFQRLLQDTQGEVTEVRRAD
jgi:hypothetical protein